MEERSTEGPGGEERARGKPGGTERPAGGLWLGIIGLLVIIIAGMYVWKEVAVGDARQAASAARDSLVRAQDRALTERTENLLRLSAIPLAWAVRPELMRRNYGQVNAFLGEFVQEESVEQVVVATAGDSIVAATDQGLVGRRFSSLHPAELLEASAPRVTSADGTYRVAVPILGQTRTQGVLVVTYRPPAPGAAGPAPPASPEAEEEPGARRDRDTARNP